MKSKASRVTLASLFLAMIFLPGLLWLFLGAKLQGPNLEKRELAEWPEFSFSQIESLPGQLEKYYRDHLPFREQLIGAYARVNKALFDDSVVTTVLFGKNGWYFYRNPNEGDPIASYRGEDLFTAEELRQIVINLRRTRDNLARQGIDFVLFIAPNKERLYAEYMPDRFGAPAPDYGALQLIDFLRAHTDLRVVYCYDALMQAKADFADYTLYYPTDTHWNEIGAYVGAQVLMAELGVDLPPLQRENIQLLDAVCTGDLTVLAHLYTEGEGDPKYNVAIPGQPGFDVEHDDLLYKLWARGDANGKRLFMRHDSFASGMQPYMIPWFSYTAAYRNEVYEDAQVDEADPDLFVQVCVERRLRDQLLSGPLYTSPQNR